ncbi:zinc finger SWIM domain-containing 8-like [Brachionus plicatilis]|uniref:Zinc finger SWIM domain-containing 8-like n=1 Tax=Brachionus plicatilis TaxID=10195 RepID=A0A3M7PZE2_BRAPC|nr:zinc finger SWIM domain-containing 8-like [Brachionus plicatilis]
MSRFLQQTNSSGSDQPDTSNDTRNNASNQAQTNANMLWNDPNDDFDSDQLDEDDSYSWASTDNPDGLPGSSVPNQNPSLPNALANWRDWKSSNYNDPYFNQLNMLSQTIGKPKRDDSFRIEKLVDLCANYVASSIPFELVETYKQPVPEYLQLKITKASFPETIDNIRLYSCLANGNADEYMKGEQMYRAKCVRKLLQIGFHLSAQVSPSISQTNSNNLSYYNSKQNNILLSGFANGCFSVSLVCDRKRIVYCTCTCSKQAVSWCCHIVAVCLSRILDSDLVEYRAPVSESLSKLKRDQLQKFAQYLISELPQQNQLNKMNKLNKINYIYIKKIDLTDDPYVNLAYNFASIDLLPLPLLLPMSFPF